MAYSRFVCMIPYGLFTKPLRGLLCSLEHFQHNARAQPQQNKNAIASPHCEASGDTTPCRMTGVTLDRSRPLYGVMMDVACVKSLRSSYMGWYPQKALSQSCSPQLRSRRPRSSRESRAPRSRRASRPERKRRSARHVRVLGACTPGFPVFAQFEPS
jgi:hypothetical protein